MRLLCCIVTHNRPEYSMKTILSWAETRQALDTVVVIDNASTELLALAMLEGLAVGGKDAFPGLSLIRNEKNLFPGAATNIGWHLGQSLFGDFDLLMRSDNDIEYLPGWREEVERCFEAFPTLGQLGILNMHEDYDGRQPVTPWWSSGEPTSWGHMVNVNSPWVGGNCVIRRELWDHGLRWDSNPWRPGANEDTLMSQAIHDLGWRVARVIPTIANNLSFHRYEDYSSYYDETARLRGLVPELSV